MDQPPFYTLYWYAGLIMYYVTVAIIIYCLVQLTFILENPIHLRVLDHLNKILLACCSAIFFVYLYELYTTWKTGYIYEQWSFYNRALGSYWISYIIMLFGQCILPQLLWSKKNRRKLGLSLMIAIGLMFVMYYERGLIILVTLLRDWG